MSLGRFPGRLLTAWGLIGFVGMGIAPAQDENTSALPDGFVYLRDVAPAVVLDIRYAGADNFLGRPADGYRGASGILTRPAAQALLRAQEELSEQGYRLVVMDGYRPQRAVDDFSAWAKTPPDPKMRRRFFPTVPKSELFQRGYIASRSGHSRGSTVDILLLRGVKTPPEKIPVGCLDDMPMPDWLVDMGTGWDCFDKRSHTNTDDITKQQRANRLLLKRAMERQGFRNLPEEWWHYSLKDEPYPDTYFDFPVE